MSASNITEHWFDLSPLGFPGWEHNTAYRATTNSRGGHAPLCVEVRMVGSNFAARLFDNGRGLFEIIKAHVEKTEALIAKQDRRAA